MIEADTVPKTIVGQGRMRFLAPAGGTEPIGNRIITVPQDQAAREQPRSHVGVHRLRADGQHRQGQGAGRDAAASGKTIACTHLPRRHAEGPGNVPRLAGLHPIYIARQLYLFKDGTRNGVDAQLMKKPVARLTDDDILAIAAYLARCRRTFPGADVVQAFGPAREIEMRSGRRGLVILVTVASAVAILLVAGRIPVVQGQGAQGPRFAAVPGEKGGQDIFGGYEVVPNWPKPLSDACPGNEKWTYGAGQSVFAESPNRVFVLQRGELPNIAAAGDDQAAAARPEHRVPDLPASVARRDGGQPSRERSKPRRQGRRRLRTWASPASTSAGRTASSWSTRNGDIIEDWTQWDKMLRRPHAVYISPYDPREARLDRRRLPARDLHVQQRRQAAPADDRRAERARGGRQALLPADVHGVAAGRHVLRRRRLREHARREVRQERQVPDDVGRDGRDGRARNRRRGPATSTTCTASRVDPVTRQVFVNDRQQPPHPGVRRERQVPPRVELRSGRRRTSTCSSSTADRYLWAADRGTSKMLKYDLDGNFLYSWGTWGDFPGGMWGVHGLSTDQEGNFYVAEVDSGRAQKYRPRPGANPAFLLGKPVYAAWK